MIADTGSTTKQMGTSRGEPSGAIVASVARRAHARKARSVGPRTGVDDIATYHAACEPHSRIGVLVARVSDPGPPARHIATRKVVRVRGSELEVRDDRIVGEAPLEIRAAGPGQTPVAVAVTMRTPGNDEELAVGFLFTEGIIQSRDQVTGVTSIAFDENKVLVKLREDVQPLLQKAERNFYTTSSCGVCGKSSIDAIKTISFYENSRDEVCLKADLFYELEDVLRKQQAVFESTGGLHASALFDLDGNFKMLREDVGRHNALDKLIGSAFLHDELPLSNSILLLSGRASFELIQKAAMAGIKIVAAVGAPSSLAVQLADDMNITLIGFLRNRRFNIYSGVQRIRL
jgi:FdhD protein